MVPDPVPLLKDIFKFSDRDIQNIKEAMATNPGIAEAKKPMYLFLIQFLLAHVKCFDAHLSYSDENNYYMEREWRVIGDVKFHIDDVYRIFVPHSYARRLRDDLPDYVGQITLLD